MGNLIRWMKCVFVLIMCAAGSACSPRDEQFPIVEINNKVNEKIAFKNFSTGIKIDSELKRARDKSLTWTYFGNPRVLQYEALDDGTVVRLSFKLKDSWEGSGLKDELERKFKSQGLLNFQFQCESRSATVEFAGKRVDVTDESCHADDGGQILLIKRRWPQYEEPLAKQFPHFNALIDTGEVSLYDVKLQVQKRKEEGERSTENNKKQAAEAAKDL